jgi:GNAT superfamily N-acetyltransferase
MEYLSLEDPESMRAEILDLYGSVDWQRYTEDPDQLMRALEGSDVVIAVDGGDLVGLARAVSDGETIVYVQDLLVRPSAQRQGVATQLMTWLLEPYAAVKQKILLTNDKEDQRLFYESLGFSIVSGEQRAFYRFD